MNILEKIIKAITNILKKKYDKIPIYSNDIVDGYKKPCYFIKIDKFISKKIKLKMYKITSNIEIAYICTDFEKNQIEKLEKASEISNLFLDEIVYISENIVTEIQTTETNIYEDYITISFEINLDIIEELTEEEMQKIENMEKLYIEGE